MVVATNVSLRRRMPLEATPDRSQCAEGDALSAAYLVIIFRLLLMETY